MRYEIIDSHRNWTEKKKEELKNFFTIVKGIDENSALSQVDFIDSYKKENTAICFEVIATDKSKVAGYMRCYNDPKRKDRWLVGDINVLPEYRQKNIATTLYDMILDELATYENAKYLEASISSSNIKSIGLHEKVGFTDTKKKKEFANFFFAEDETFFIKKLYKYFPFPDNELSRNMFGRLWTEYIKKRNKSESRYNAMSSEEVFNEAQIISIWHGDALVGFYIDDEEELEYIKGE